MGGRGASGRADVAERFGPLPLGNGISEIIRDHRESSQALGPAAGPGAAFVRTGAEAGAITEYSPYRIAVID